LTSLISTAPKTEKAIWNNTEITTFIDYLIAHKSEGGDGASFKSSTLIAALPVLVPLWTAGPIKTVTMCKGKWQTVNGNFIPYILNDD
jgi:hypothetical protein